MDIREISTILIEPVDELFFEKNEVVYQLTETFAPRRTSQSLQRRSPRATYARPRPPSHPPLSEAKGPVVRRSRTTEPLVRQYRPDAPTYVTPQRPVQQVPPAVAQPIPPVESPKRSSGMSAYLLLLVLLLIGVLGGIGFGYLLSTSQSLPAQISFSLAHHLINSHVNFLHVG